MLQPARGYMNIVNSWFGKELPPPRELRKLSIEIATKPYGDACG